MDETSRGEHVEEIGFVGVHRDHCLGMILPEISHHFSESCGLIFRMILSENRYPPFGIMRLIFRMILSENRYPLFGIMRLAMLASAPLCNRSGALCKSF